MIDRKELMIGNILLFDETEPVVITEIYKKKVKFYDVIDNIRKVEGTVGLICLKPILISEGLLLKSGFEKENGRHGDYFFHSVFKGFRLWIDDITGGYTIGRKDFRPNKGTYGIKDDVIQLHKLQNLFYALTGQELEVNI